MSEDQTEDDSKRSCWRSDLEKVLERKEKWIKVDDVELVPACPAGENFAGDVFRVVVYGRRLCLGVWTVSDIINYKKRKSKLGLNKNEEESVKKKTNLKRNEKKGKLQILIKRRKRVYTKNVVPDELRLLKVKYESRSASTVTPKSFLQAESSADVRNNLAKFYTINTQTHTGNKCARNLVKIQLMQGDDYLLAKTIMESFLLSAFGSQLRRLLLSFILPDIRKNFIVKRVPDPSSPCHGFYNCLRMFQNEIAAYEHILPMCQNYLDKKSWNEATESCFPKYYGQIHNFIVLQDLQTEGYQLVNRVKGFSVKECSIVLQELSKFHALSFALKQNDGVSFWKNVDKLKEVVFREEHVHDLVGVFWENSAKFALKSVEESGDPRFKRVSAILKFYSGRILKTMIDLIRPSFSKFEVLCHGDLWSNNILLRYCESGYPVGVKFIDLQGMRYCSCVLDVMHVLFTSSRPVIYERHFDLLLSEYYCSLVTNLKKLETVPNFTFDEFMTEFKTKIFFGVFLACLMLTCITRTRTSTGELSEVRLTKKELTSEPELQKMYKALSPGYHKRLHALFLALTDSNLI